MLRPEEGWEKIMDRDGYTTDMEKQSLMYFHKDLKLESRNTETPVHTFCWQCLNSALVMFEAVVCGAALECIILYLSVYENELLMAYYNINVGQ